MVNIYLSSKAFSKALGVGKTSLSRWENGLQQHSEMNDRLIRATYIILKGIKREDAIQVFRHLAKIQLRKIDIDKNVIIAKKIEDDYVVAWKMIVESQTAGFVRIWMPTHKLYHTIASPQASVGNRSKTKSDLTFFSLEALKTKSDQQPVIYY